MFTYKGKSSKDMHLRVLNDLIFASPRRDVNVIQVPGRDGDLVMDNGRYESVIRSVPCRLEVPNDVKVESVINDLNNWLINEGGFHEFSWENDPDFKYLARVENGIVSQRILSQFGNTTIDFKIHPIKYLKTGFEERPVVNNTTLTNPFGIAAKPIIRIVGSGDITINFGGRPLVLTGIGGGCIVDTEEQTITDLNGRVTLFKNMRSLFPELKPGNNQVTFSRNDIQVFVTPRLGALV